MILAAQAGAIAANILRRPADPYVLIDGNWLRQEILEFGKRYFGISELPVDWFMPFPSSNKTFYFDALPSKKPSQDQATFDAIHAAKAAELARISEFPNTHVRSGVAFHRKQRGGLEQKGVDILLAIQAMVMAYRGVTSNIVLVLGDLDFLPLVDELVSIGVTVELRHSKRTNKELIRAADRASPLRIDEMMTAFHSQSYYLPTSLVIDPQSSRPPETGGWIAADEGKAALVPTGSEWSLKIFYPEKAPIHLRHASKDTLIAWGEDHFDLRTAVSEHEGS
jgi:hypothetical protein